MAFLAEASPPRRPRRRASRPRDHRHPGGGRPNSRCAARRGHGARDVPAPLHDRSRRGRADRAGSGATWSRDMTEAARQPGPPRAVRASIAAPSSSRRPRSSRALELQSACGNRAFGRLLHSPSPQSDQLHALAATPLDSLLSAQGDDEARRRRRRGARQLSEPPRRPLARAAVWARLGETAKKLPVEVHYFPGTTARRALVIAGVHGSRAPGHPGGEPADERSEGDAAAFSVMLVPTLFPDNAAEGPPASRENGTTDQPQLPDARQGLRGVGRQGREGQRDPAPRTRC